MMSKRIRRIAVTAFAVISAAACPANSDDYRYESRGRRDPFVPLIGLEKAGVLSLQEVESVDDLILEGIASDPKGKRIAIINGKLMRENERAGVVEIKNITANMVTLSMGGQVHNIKLPERGGGGGKSDR